MHVESSTHRTQVPVVVLQAGPAGPVQLSLDRHCTQRPAGSWQSGVLPVGLQLVSPQGIRFPASLDVPPSLPAVPAVPPAPLEPPAPDAPPVAPVPPCPATPAVPPLLVASSSPPHAVKTAPAAIHNKSVLSRHFVMGASAREPAPTLVRAREGGQYFASSSARKPNL